MYGYVCTNMTYSPHRVARLLFLIIFGVRFNLPLWRTSAAAFLHLLRVIKIAETRAVK